MIEHSKSGTKCPKCWEHTKEGTANSGQERSALGKKKKKHLGGLIMKDEKELGSWGMKLGKARLQTWVKLTLGAEFLRRYITYPEVRGFTQS